MAFACLHLGAGNLKDHYKYCELVEACLNTADSHAALDTCARILCDLEDSPLVNCGQGANVNCANEAELDASLAVSSGLFASVGALKHIRHPSLVVKGLLEDLQESLTDDGYPKPRMLVGPGAQLYASIMGLPLEKLSSSKSRHPNDTVGVIVHDGVSICVGSSSGGAFRKHEGRVGSAALYGMGIYIRHNDEKAIACATSGIGEQIMDSFLAKTIVDLAMESESIERTLDDFMKNNKHNQYGFLLIVSTGGRNGLWCCFSTESMIIGWKAGADTHYKYLQNDHNLGYGFFRITLT